MNNTTKTNSNKEVKALLQEIAVLKSLPLTLERKMHIQKLQQKIDNYDM